MSKREKASQLKRPALKKQKSFRKNEVHCRIMDICEQIKKRRVHPSTSTNTAAIHAQHSPSCLLVQSKKTTVDQENSSKRLKVDQTPKYLLVETNTLKGARHRSFSHWPHRQKPSVSQMIAAGFFNCNVGDRVICLYCNLICQQWLPDLDDPQEIHRTLSPQCPYILLILNNHQTTTISILNQNSTDNSNTQLRALDIPHRSNEIVSTSACHRDYVEIPKRQASFASWPQESLPSVDDLVRAGFFYTGTNTIVTCFYCNGSLQNWGPNDNPTVEHSRWFPICAYARQLCGEELYRKIQESKRAIQEDTKVNQSGRNGNNNSRLLIPDESTLSRLVAARLDLPISQNLLNQNFKLSIIKRCWEDQLRLKQDDFVSDCDLLTACIILQKQIDHINGNKENIVIPNIRMKLMREKEQNQTLTIEQPTSSSLISSTPIADELPVENIIKQKDITTSVTSTIKEENIEKKINSESNSSSTNVCVLCWTEEKRLACIPCGHLATCVPCGHSLRTCPICRQEIEAFVRIYI